MRLQYLKQRYACVPIVVRVPDRNTASMRFVPLAILVAPSLYLAACSTSQLDVPPAGSDVAMAGAGNTNGQQAYEIACAACHDDGIGGAPQTGNPQAWDERSSLWEAVLFEHAKSGYLDMPARGGATRLPDATVEKAAEYMLSITHPERPPDGD